MLEYTLELRTYTKQLKAKTKLCGEIRIKGGRVLHEVLYVSTLTDLSRKLRKTNLIPTDVQIDKKNVVEFKYQSKKPL